MASIGTFIKRQIMSFRLKKIEQLRLDFFVPIFFLPTFFLVASYNFYSTIFVLSIVSILGIHLYIAHLTRQSKSQLFFMWNIVSLFLIFLCLEFLIVPQMVVGPWENISFYLLLVAVLCDFRTIKRRAVQSIRSDRRNEYDEYPAPVNVHYCSVCSRKVSEKFSHCGICHVCVFERSHHCVWINCCISVANRKQFLALHILLLAWLCYSSYLILTTVCKSWLLNNSILVPEDCSSAYSTFRSSFSFVGAIYGLEISVLVFLSFIQELVCSQGMLRKQKEPREWIGTESQTLKISLTYE